MTNYVPNRQPIGASITSFEPEPIAIRKDEALKDQIGGNHYKAMVIQPVEFIHANNFGFIQGNIIKYVCRYKEKNGFEDLEKAKHYIELLIELEKKYESKRIPPK